MNPRAAVNDLHPFQGCLFGQLGYFSELYRLRKQSRIVFLQKYKIRNANLFHSLFAFRQKENGEGGIRTHVPLRTNGFQDRLVMTTSIPLRTI